MIFVLNRLHPEKNVFPNGYINYFQVRQAKAINRSNLCQVRCVRRIVYIKCRLWGGGYGNSITPRSKHQFSSMIPLPPSLSFFHTELYTLPFHLFSVSNFPVDAIQSTVLNYYIFSYFFLSLIANK